MEKQILNIEKNANRIEGSFVELLIEGVFNKELYNRLIKDIYDLNASNLTIVERFKYSNFIWCISFDTIKHISFDRDLTDIYKIKGLNEEEKRILHDIMYDIPNSFSYNTPFDLSFCFL